MKRADGTGSVYQPTYKDKDGNTPTVRSWYIRYRGPDGRQRKESTDANTESQAEKILRQRLSDQDHGRPTGPAVGKTTFEDLAGLIRTDYRVNGRKSADDLHARLEHLAATFGGWKVKALDAGHVESYKDTRLEAGAKPATVNRELAVLKRMFRLGLRACRVATRPEITLLKENNRRRGFFERDEHERVIAHMPKDAASVAEFLYWTGWRRGEVVGLQWSDIDTRAKVIRIEDSKAGEPRTLPYGKLPALVELVERRRKITDAVQQEAGSIVPWVFHRDGHPIRHFRRSWISACVASALGHEVRDKDGQLVKKIAHRTPRDYRRSAARNLSRAGVPEQVMMALCGWKTRSVFDRYRIVAERDLADGLAKLAETIDVVAPTTNGSVATMRRRGR